MALKPLKKVKAPTYRPQMQSLINQGKLSYKPVANLGYKPPPAPKPKQQWTDWNQQTGRGGPGYTGYDGPGVQDYINQGTIKFDAGLGSIGYTPPPTTVPQFGGDGGGAGMIGGDWEVAQAEAAMGEQMARARGDFQSGLRQMLVDLGLSDTSKLGSLGKYIDKDTITKAVENKYSATAQIGQQAEKARAVNNAALAARGILSSGQTTKTQSDVSGAAEQGRYEALRDFLGQGASGLRGLGDLEYQMAQGVAAARQNAAMRSAELYPESWLGPEEQQLMASPQAQTARTTRPGWVRAPSGHVYMNQQTFRQQRPQGNYQQYLAYLKRQRGGKL